MPLSKVENRAHPRIAAPVRARVVTGDRRTELPVRDISLGGIFVFTPEQLFPIGEQMLLEIGLPDDRPEVTLTAEVVRTVLGEKGEVLGVGMHFVEVTSEQRAKLGAMLERLLEGPGGQRRAFARVAHRLEVDCTGVKKARAVLRDLSLGGAGVFTEAPLAVGETITVTLTRPGKAAIELRAVVVSTRWAREGEPYDSAGVKFEPMPDKAKAELREFIGGLVGGRPG
jgi:c-di-GMP-binding flagellar brake protein YcgR